MTVIRKLLGSRKAWAALGGGSLGNRINDS